MAREGWREGWREELRRGGWRGGGRRAIRRHVHTAHCTLPSPPQKGTVEDTLASSNSILEMGAALLNNLLSIDQ